MLIAVLTLCGVNLLAQAPPAAAAPSESTPEATPPVANILTAEPLPTSHSPLHCGNPSVLSFSGDQFYWLNFGFDGAQQTDARATQFSGLVVYSLHHRNLGFDIQYRPALWFTDSGKQLDLANQMF